MRCLGNKFGRLFENGMQRIVWCVGADDYKKSPLIGCDQRAFMLHSRRVAECNCDSRFSAATKSGSYGIGLCIFAPEFPQIPFVDT